LQLLAISEEAEKGCLVRIRPMTGHDMQTVHGCGRRNDNQQTRTVEYDKDTADILLEEHNRGSCIAEKACLLPRAGSML
jgi:hypothetical protein